jgi:hypothetical protein
VRFNRGANEGFHFACASVGKHLLHLWRQRCRDKFWIVFAHGGDGKRFVVHADEKLTAFVELETAISMATSDVSDHGDKVESLS